MNFSQNLSSQELKLKKLWTCSVVRIYQFFSFSVSLLLRNGTINPWTQIFVLPIYRMISHCFSPLFSCWRNTINAPVISSTTFGKDIVMEFTDMDSDH